MPTHRWWNRPFLSLVPIPVTLLVCAWCGKPWEMATCLGCGSETARRKEV